MYQCTDRYVFVENANEWLSCPECGLKPLAWIFDNGRYAACGCGDNEYNHFLVRAKSICSYLDRRDNYHHEKYNDFWLDEYDSELRENWNTYCETGDFLTYNKILEEQGIKIW